MSWGKEDGPTEDREVWSRQARKSNLIKELSGHPRRRDEGGFGSRR